MKRHISGILLTGALLVLAVLVGMSIQGNHFVVSPTEAKKAPTFDDLIIQNGDKMIADGRLIFRFDTFGDEDFWGDTLQLHKTIAGEANGGIGPGLSPSAALDLGLKVDVDALPRKLQNDLKRGKVDLSDPATTLALLQLNAVVGVKGIFVSGKIESIGITCALCHSTVDDSFSPGIGHRLDGWANRDLNVGAIIAFAPNMQPFVDLLSVVIPTIDAATVRAVLGSWGPGKFDAELLFDGKAVNPQQITNGVITGTNVPGATLLPNAFGLAGVNQHTWAGAWGTVTYWNAFVANLEMRGKGTFFDPRLDDAQKFPIAAAKGFGHVFTNADQDLITSKLPALHFYQLAIPAPKPQANVHFDPAAAARGDALFSAAGKAGCGKCHVEPLWTEPGWNLHTPEEMKIDSFQANRAPDDTYRTMNLAGIYVRELGIFMKQTNKGRFYHDGRFATLLDVVNSYNDRFNLGLTTQEKGDIVEYLKSL